MLATTGKILAEEKGVWVILTYADLKAGHTGGLYRAANFYSLGVRKGKRRFVGIIAKENRDVVKGLFLSRNSGRLENFKEKNI